MVAIRCEGNHGNCKTTLAMKRDDHVVEYENSGKTRILIFGLAIFRCPKCGIYTRVDPMAEVFDREIREKSLTSTHNAWQAKEKPV